MWREDERTRRLAKALAAWRRLRGRRVGWECESCGTHYKGREKPARCLKCGCVGSRWAEVRVKKPFAYKDL